MAAPEFILQALFGTFAILSMIAGLHYRDSIFCVGFRRLFNREDDSMSSKFTSVLIDFAN